MIYRDFYEIKEVTIRAEDLGLELVVGNILEFIGFEILKKYRIQGYRANLAKIQISLRATGFQICISSIILISKISLLSKISILEFSLKIPSKSHFLKMKNKTLVFKNDFLWGLPIGRNVR